MQIAIDFSTISTKQKCEIFRWEFTASIITRRDCKLTRLCVSRNSYKISFVAKKRENVTIPFRSGKGPILIRQRRRYSVFDFEYTNATERNGPLMRNTPIPCRLSLFGRKIWLWLIFSVFFFSQKKGGSLGLLAISVPKVWSLRSIQYGRLSGPGTGVWGDLTDTPSPTHPLLTPYSPSSWSVWIMRRPSQLVVVDEQSVELVEFAGRVCGLAFDANNGYQLTTTLSFSIQTKTYVCMYNKMYAQTCNILCN